MEESSMDEDNIPLSIFAAGRQHNDPQDRVEKDKLDESAWATDDNTPLLVIANAMAGQSSNQEARVTVLDTDDEPLINLIVPEAATDDDPDWQAVSSDGEESPAQRKTTKRLRCGVHRNHRGSHSQADPELESVIAASASAMRRQDRELAEHQSKLNNILTANGYFKTSVPSDGNCFFVSAAQHLPDTDASTLRQVLCDYLEQNIFDYIEFLSNEDTTLDEIKTLREPGIWNNAAADFLPRALADWSGRPVKIFTSDLYAPVHLVEPKELVARQLITLSLLTVGASHYEPVFQIPRASEQERNAPHSANDTREEGAPQSPLPDLHTDAPTPSSPCSVVQVDPPDVETPRKHGHFSTPPKKNLFRKRGANTSTWKKNTRKRLRLEGKQYFSESGKVRPAKQVLPVDCSKCRFKCSRISEEKRQNIFSTFYSIDTYDRQKDFVCSNVRESATRKYLDQFNKPVSQKRKVSRTYSFCIDGCTERVCKKFFLATLNLDESYVDHAMKNSEHGTYTGRDRRGRHRPHNKTPEIVIQRAKDHIESFPVVESHYTRKDTQRKYLAADLNIKKMYELHREECGAKGLSCVSANRYRAIFNENYNFSFHVPKKDQCLKCTLHASKSKLGTLTEDDEKSYSEHQRKKEDARKEKEKDKQSAMKNDRLHVITVDMQAVLPTPCGAVSQLYYKRKLSVYNFTTYSLSDKRAVCYLWDETEAKRGACEIATCLLMYISALPQNIKDVVIYSDCCAGQNRNQYLATCFMHAVNTIPNIETITHKYLESGHTHMECDSMHSAITFAKKNTPIFVQ